MNLPMNLVLQWSRLELRITRSQSQDPARVWGHSTRRTAVAVHFGSGDRRLARNVTRRKGRLGRAILWVVVILLFLCIGPASARRSNARSPETGVRPIREGITLPWELVGGAWRAVFGLKAPEAPCEAFVRHLPLEASGPIAHVPIPAHPFMAAGRGSNMHCDAYMSDAYEAAGPVGIDMQISSRSEGFGGYGTITFDKQGRLVGVYSNGRGFRLELLDPNTLEVLATHKLPARPWYWLLQGILPWKYIGAGMYFYLDEQDRAVVPTTRNTIQVIQAPGGDGEFELVREIDLQDHVVPMRWPHRDSVAWVLPDWSGEVYWFATTGGVVGTVAVDGSAVRTIRLDAEILENSYAVAEDGVYIVSDRALYRFTRGTDGEISVAWRTEYDRGPAAKPGHITRGSGTSVSLMGGADGLVAITDNAEPRIRLLFVQRTDGAVVGSMPLFEEGRSGTDISAACFEHADETGAGTGVYSVVVENNWGHHRFPTSHPEPGLTRVDLTRHPDGTTTCEEVWTNPVRGINVFKLSFGSGLVYTYWRGDTCPKTTWMLTAIDFASGETAFRQQIGTGLGFNNWAGALFLHPDGGVAYSTTIFGMVRMADAPRHSDE